MLYIAGRPTHDTSLLLSVDIKQWELSSSLVRTKDVGQEGKQLDNV